MYGEMIKEIENLILELQKIENRLRLKLLLEKMKKKIIFFE